MNVQPLNFKKNVMIWQVLAINRGEHHKILRVKVEIPNFLEKVLMEMCRRKWLNYNMNTDSKKIINQSLEDAYQRLMQPQIVRLVRYDWWPVVTQKIFKCFPMICWKNKTEPFSFKSEQDCYINYFKHQFLLYNLRYWTWSWQWIYFVYRDRVTDIGNHDWHR